MYIEREIYIYIYIYADGQSGYRRPAPTDGRRSATNVQTRIGKGLSARSEVHE